jgi:ribonuclease PH
MARAGRAANEMRPVQITLGWNKFAEGSCLIEFGGTRVLCTASVEENLPPWLRGKMQGWVTSEYGMLPRACPTRNVRDATRGRPDARSQEIQRLIGRSLRSVINLHGFGERTIYVDCDVLQADGGTRTAAITGGYVALVEAFCKLRRQNLIRTLPVSTNVAAVSVGIVNKEELLDLSYDEDSQATVDMNVVMTGNGQLVEVQATAERHPFSRATLARLLELAHAGIQQLIQKQDEALKDLL